MGGAPDLVGLHLPGARVPGCGRRDAEVRTCVRQYKRCGGYSRNSIYAAIGTTVFGVSVGGGKIMMGVNTNMPPAGQDLSIISPSTYNDGQWHQIIAGREQSSADYWLIIDGVEVGRSKGNTGALSGPTSVSLGRARADLGGQFFSGSIRAVHFYSLSLFTSFSSTALAATTFAATVATWRGH